MRSLFILACRLGLGRTLEDEAGGWVRHASGVLVADTGAAESEWNASAGAGEPAFGLGSQWPPAGARELDVEFLYDRLAEAGFGYGPAFQGVQAAWRTDTEVYAEVALDTTPPLTPPGTASTPRCSMPRCTVFTC